jgi:hypothetical protein
MVGNREDQKKDRESDAEQFVSHPILLQCVMSLMDYSTPVLNPKLW